LLSLSEKQRLDTTKHINKRREYLLSRALIRHALSKQFHHPLNTWDFIEQANSLPIISNLPANTYFSLSHSNGLICFITSSTPIGIDIEDTSKKRNYRELAEAFMSSQERRILKKYQHNNLVNYFYRIWCAKEAYYKTCKTHALTNLNDISILSFIKNNSEWRLIEGHIDSFTFSIITEKNSLPLITNWFKPKMN